MLCFIDYTNAIDCVKGEEIIKLADQLNIDGKDLGKIIIKKYPGSKQRP